MKRLRLFFSPHTMVLYALSTMMAMTMAGFLTSTPVDAATSMLPAHSMHVTHLAPHIFKVHGRGNNSKADNVDQLTYNGGPVMHSSVTYAIFWEPPTLQDGSSTQVSSTYNSILQNYFGDIGGSGVYAIATQYHDTTGTIANNSTFGGAWTDTSAYPASQCSDSATPQDCMTDAQIQDEVTKALAANNWTSGRTHMFFVFTSTNEGSCFDSGSSSCAFTQYCAYHSFYSDNNNQPIIYANMPYTGTNLSACGVSSSPNNDFDADSTINVTSHEHMEAVTDPQLNAWYDSQGNEIGDKCAWNFGVLTLDNNAANVQWNSHFYLVQQEWSNAISGCALSYSVPQPSGVVYAGANDGSVFALNTNNGTLLWHYKTGGAVISSPIVVHNTVFVGSKDHFVYAFNASTGALLWRTRTGNAVYSSPQVVNGTLFVGSVDGFFYALNSSTGAVRWRFNAGGSISTTPAIANNVAYLSSSNGLLFALNTSRGSVLWRSLVRGSVFSSPTVVNNIVYVGGSNGFVYAFNDGNGRLIWHFSAGRAMWQTATVANNIVYIGSSNGFFYALDALKGTQKWRYHTNGSIGSQATVDNGVVYVGSYDHNLYALNATNGGLIWRYQTGGHILSTAAIASGVIYFGSDDHNLYALNETTSLLSWHYLAGGPVESSPAVVLP